MFWAVTLSSASSTVRGKDFLASGEYSEGNLEADLSQ
jgi:hypothetical protein